MRGHFGTCFYLCELRAVGYYQFAKFVAGGREHKPPQTAAALEGVTLKLTQCGRQDHLFYTSAAAEGIVADYGE